MKNFILTLLVLFSTNLFSQNKSISEKPSIDVLGQADTLIVPNKITINILLMEKDFKGKKSVEEMEKEMIKKLQEIGIDITKKLSVSDFSSNYKFYLLKQTDIFKSKTFSLEVSDAMSASKVFIGLENIGISNVRIEKIEHTEEKKIKLLINGKAILNARQSAESFTKPLNQKIGNAIQISHFDDISSQLAGRLAGVAVVGYSAKKYEAESPYNENVIEFQKIKISSSVQAKFSIE